MSSLHSAAEAASARGFLIQQSFREMQERLHVVEVRQHADRDAHRAAGFAVDAQTEIIQRKPLFVAGTVEAHVQFDA